MASAYPIAAFLVFALIGLFLFPVAWWALAFWQKKKNLKTLSKVSMYLSVTPILAFGFLYIGKEGFLIPPMLAGLIFFATPALNIIFLVVGVIMTIIQPTRSINESR